MHSLVIFYTSKLNNLLKLKYYRPIRKVYISVQTFTATASNVIVTGLDPVSLVKLRTID